MKYKWLDNGAFQFGDPHKIHQIAKLKSLSIFLYMQYVKNQPKCHTWPMPFHGPNYIVATLMLIRYLCIVALQGLAGWSVLLLLFLLLLLQACGLHNQV